MPPLSGTGMDEASLPSGFPIAGVVPLQAFVNVPLKGRCVFDPARNILPVLIQQFPQDNTGLTVLLIAEVDTVPKATFAGRVG